MSGQTITIRLARLEDAQQIHEIIKAGYRSEKGWTHEADLVKGDRISLKELQDHLQDATLMDKRPIFSAISEDGRVLGCIQAIRGSERPALALFAVDPQIQSQGIGKKLVAHVLSFVEKDWHALEIELWTLEGRSELIAWYKRLGFKDVTEAEGGKKDFVAPERLLSKARGWRFVVLRKDLGEHVQ